MIDPIETTIIEAEPTHPSLEEYRSALRRYEGYQLAEVLRAIGIQDAGTKPGTWADAIADRLAEPRDLERILARLDHGPRLVLGLLALVEAASWPSAGLELTLRCLGLDPAPALRRLFELGLLAARIGPVGSPPPDLSKLLEGQADAEVVPHPAALAAARTVLPEGPGPPAVGMVRQVREADGLEPILRLAALWQRVDEAPLRQTQQGQLYKRDRERLEDDPALAGPIADALEPLPDIVPLGLALARGLGLIVGEPGTDRIVAAPASFWSENAIHLPQMVALRWLGLHTWHEQGGSQEDGATVALAVPFVRPAVLLLLARYSESEWVAIDDLAEHWNMLAPGWDRPGLSELVGPTAGAKGGPGRNPIDPGGLLDALLLGPAYQIGLIRAAEEVPSGRRVVQLSPLGRYALALGPPPPPRPAFDQFLFVQPNFEIIAYRQGLTPPLIGQFSRFARWTQLGSALEMRLTAESVYRGLEGGMTPEQMLDRLGRHSPRPLPAGVAEALRTWAQRRQRVTYYASATLIEFASPEVLEAALAAWAEAGKPEPARISDRLLLVEDERSIPFQRFRMAGSRDYRRPPDACLEVEPDGVSLSLDLGRSDLFIDAEIARFADPAPDGPSHEVHGAPRRRFRVSPASIARLIDDGQAPALLDRWFQRRAGQGLPPAIRLLFHAVGSRVAPLATSRPLVLNVPTADLLDGLLQHPATAPYLGERLGPTAIIIPEHAIDGLRRNLAGLGLALGRGDDG